MFILIVCAALRFAQRSLLFPLGMVHVDSQLVNVLNISKSECSAVGGSSLSTFPNPRLKEHQRREGGKDVPAREWGGELYT